VATALPVALPSEFSVAEAANAFGMNTTNKKGAYLNDALQLHGPLLRPLPLMMAKAAEQLAEEEPEQLSGRERVAARLRKATGIVATAEAQQCTADEQWWQLSIVGWLADSLAGEVDAGRLGEAVAVAALRRAAALKAPAGASTALRRHKNTARIAASLLLYALSLSGGGGDGSEAGSSSGGEADSSQAGGSSSVPLTYNTMDKAVAVCGGSRWQVLEHSKPEGALRWVFTQLGVVPPGKSAGGKVGGPAAAKAAKKNREAGGGGRGARPRPSSRARTAAAAAARRPRRPRRQRSRSSGRMLSDQQDSMEVVGGGMPQSSDGWRGACLSQDKRGCIFSAFIPYTCTAVVFHQLLAYALC
jgi:hypothetical protein